MKIKALLLATIIGAAAINGVTAGDWCPPDKGGDTYCPIDDCPDVGGSVSVGYDTDYIWKGVRWARDSVWADVNYTFANTVNVGVWHLSALDSIGNAPGSAYGDETNIYASIGLPEMMGFDADLGYVLNLFPNQRFPSGFGQGGDSFQRVYLSLQKEIMGGLTFGYLAEYYFGNTSNSPRGSLGDWYHTFGLYKTMCLTDSLSLDLSAEVGYTDSLWSGLGILHPGGVSRGSGFNHYNIRASLPIALNCRATLTPYIAYNGTPDGWKGDELNTGFFPIGNPNFNDVFYGGVSLNVKF